MFRWHTLTMRTGLTVERVENAIHEQLDGGYDASDVYVEQHGHFGVTDQVVVTLEMPEDDRREALTSLLDAHADAVDAAVVLTADNTTDEADVSYHLHDDGEMVKVGEDEGSVLDSVFEFDGVTPRTVV